jgi:hypothetical protein
MVVLGLGFGWGIGLLVYLVGSGSEKRLGLVRFGWWFGNAADVACRGGMEVKLSLLSVGRRGCM